MNKIKYLSVNFTLIVTLALTACAHNSDQQGVQPSLTKVNSEDQLLREAYQSSVDQSDREYFVYLPRGYHDKPEKKWPVMLFLHGNGERGNGQDELDFVMMQGPLHEVWVQKKDLPFIIISPQLHMFGWDNKGIEYIDNRLKENIPKRLSHGVPKRSAAFQTQTDIKRMPSLNDMSEVAPLLPQGWEKLETDLITMLDTVQKKYRVNKDKTYLSGLSYGGFGTWYMASKYPQRFAAIAPVVGWGHPSLMAPIAKHKLPVWQFAGGRDSAVNIEYFYAGLNELEKMGHNGVRFTVHEDKGHDAWTRVYSGEDLYQWLLSHEIND
ncbi:alpha/beta hydrolase-fold protein [Colwellia sp. 12G3]|uniref:carboxylesterase family protein n=1 Tax=Colwellia sp. 12G3 TaxID=2058299 RepID=UPI000C32FDFA|nr:alpha/beta hydrolase-fold protein [Colwellia sp. 12G3]PKI17062.1 alpha/beta hydrolase [Colwellia sp. 12G3]